MYKNLGNCPDGATDQEHYTMIEMTGQCPWCGAEESDGAGEQED